MFWVNRHLVGGFSNALGSITLRFRCWKLMGSTEDRKRVSKTSGVKPCVVCSDHRHALQLSHEGLLRLAAYFICSSALSGRPDAAGFEQTRVEGCGARVAVAARKLLRTDTE